MTPTSTLSQTQKPEIEWEKLPPDFPLPDDPVDNILQPLLAAILREILELAGLISAEMLIATNFGLCAKVDGKTVVKAPDWVYVRKVNQGNENKRSYTPHLEGEVPLMVMEFLSDTDGGEYSVNPNYPYGKWYFYEKILEVPFYIIFEPESGRLEVYRLISGHYEKQSPDELGYYWISEMGLYLGVWQGTKTQISGNWLRWWDSDQNMLPLGTEGIEQERQRTETERQRAQQIQTQFEQEQQRTTRMAEYLRSLGVDPDNL
ncbi:Uma2 family endonuclease [Gloeothece verrucosa]|uniref:Putative restriction endonuclease domain-containing protein n=1 Tax=Gloeothece verrucosa (strain PCC 7822) TaxID=497965 RepID=E0U833_GLOV7|nr:Uma2 family endonuclease [Gloeothece verrucosa]ADN17238.1 protein of unknown function DUF820 [Gloeothece verrucosa PCC 7822]